VKYWDSSAIVPLLLSEPGTPSMVDMLEADPVIVVWWGTPIECASALTRREREGVLGARAFSSAQEILRGLRRSWTEIVPSENLRAIAERLLRVHPLRAADSLQLAAAIVATDQNPSEADFVCLDRRLADAAEREGFSILPPG